MTKFNYPCSWHFFKPNPVQVLSFIKEELLLQDVSSMICCTNAHCLVCWQLQPISQVCVRYKHIISPYPPWQWFPAAYKVQTVCLCLFIWAFECLHPCFRSLACFMRTVDQMSADIMLFGLCPIHSTCVSCHILLIGAFHWFQSGWPVHKLCLLIVFSRNKWENPCGSEQPILFSSPSSNILNDV